MWKCRITRKIFRVGKENEIKKIEITAKSIKEILEEAGHFDDGDTIEIHIWRAEV